MTKAIIGLLLCGSLAAAAFYGWKTYSAMLAIAEHEENRAATALEAEKLRIQTEKEAEEKQAEAVRREDDRRRIALEKTKEDARKEALKIEAQKLERDNLKEKTRLAELEANNLKATQKLVEDRLNDDLAKLNAAKANENAEKYNLQAANVKKETEALELKKSEYEALKIKNSLAELEVLKSEYERGIEENNRLSIELENAIEANKPELTVQDLMTTGEESGDDSDKISAEDSSIIPEGERNLRAAKAKLTEKDEAESDKLKGEVKENLQRLLDNAVKEKRIIDAEFYMNTIKGVK